jgi:hypothetical protein
MLSTQCWQQYAICNDSLMWTHLCSMMCATSWTKCRHVIGYIWSWPLFEMHLLQLRCKRHLHIQIALLLRNVLSLDIYSQGGKTVRRILAQHGEYCIYTLCLTVERFQSGRTKVVDGNRVGLLTTSSTVKQFNILVQEDRWLVIKNVADKWVFSCMLACAFSRDDR